MSSLTTEELKLRVMKTEVERLNLIIDGVENANSAAGVALENWYSERSNLQELKASQ